MPLSKEGQLQVMRGVDWPDQAGRGGPMAQWATGLQMGAFDK